MIRRTAISMKIVCGLVDRIAAALKRFAPEAEARLNDLSPEEARELVNEVTGASIPNGPVVETLQKMAEACEAAAERKQQENTGWQRTRESMSSGTRTGKRTARRILAS